MRQWRIANPLRARFTAMKNKAKRRGIPFTISWEHFHEFVTLQAAKGIDLISEPWLTIDRINGSIGYQLGNLQILTREENAAKGNQERTRADYVAAKIARKRAPNNQPF